MIRADIGERFVIVVALWDEVTGVNASGRTVYYDIRDEDDNPVSPPMNGLLPESTVASGIYKKAMSMNTAGEYVCYATCNGFYSNTEEIIINPENIYTIAKANRNYNISVEDVPRTNGVANASQTVRNVPLNATDYIITYVKDDDEDDWDSTTTSGTSYAWYRSIDDELPFRMGSDGL